jgi:hypothetical protein
LNRELIKKERIFKIIFDKLNTTGKAYDTLPGTEAYKTLDFTSVDDNLVDLLVAEINAYYQSIRSAVT